MKNLINKSSLLVLAAIAALSLSVSTTASAQSRKEKARLAKVTFMDEYVRKANEQAAKEYEQTILDNVGTFVAPAAEKKANYSETLADGSFHIVRFRVNEAIGDHIRLIKTDADGNIQWERTYLGDGFSNEADNFMKHTKDGGYLIQQTLCNTVSPATSDLSAVVSK